MILNSHRLFDLAALPREKLLEQVSIGFGRVLAHSNRIAGTAKLLSDQGYLIESRILSLLSDEEAGKCLILLDIFRCPNSEKNLRENLGKCYNHCAKGIYVNACDWSFGDYKEFHEYVQEARKEFSDDVIGDYSTEYFPNPIFKEREELQYVDYVSLDEKKWLWQIPQENSTLTYFQSTASRLVNALKESGCTEVESIKKLDEFWKMKTIAVNTRWDEFQILTMEWLEILNSNNLLANNSDKNISFIVDQWFFPIFSLDLKIDRLS